MLPKTKRDVSPGNDKSVQAFRQPERSPILDRIIDYPAPLEIETTDVSPKNDDSPKLEYDGGFGGPRRKERTHEAVKVF